MQGHSGYLETCRRALVHTAERLAVELTEADVASLVAVWRELRPFDDSVRGIEKLRGAYRTVALSTRRAVAPRPPRGAPRGPVRRCDLRRAGGRLQAPSGSLPRRRRGARGGAPADHHGLCALLRCHGRLGLGLPGRLRGPVPAALRGLALQAGDVDSRVRGKDEGGGAASLFT